jgi:hypothetical protein
LLSKHARAALCQACHEGWISRTEFVALSEFAEFWSPESHKIPAIKAWIEMQIKDCDISSGNVGDDIAAASILGEGAARHPNYDASEAVPW